MERNHKNLARPYPFEKPGQVSGVSLFGPVFPQSGYRAEMRCGVEKGHLQNRQIPGH